MKKLFPLLAILFSASCSTPKIAAHFPSSNVDVNYHPVSAAKVETKTAAVETPVVLASVNETAIVLPDAEVKKQVAEAYRKLSKEQQREVRQLLKKEVKAIAKNQKKVASATAVAGQGGMDHDLKLAAIFGAVGVVGLLIGGNFFYVIGAIALIVGTVFFVKWLMRQ